MEVKRRGKGRGLGQSRISSPGYPLLLAGDWII
jgi:hypothetical protein